MDFYRGDDRGPTDQDLNTLGFTAKPPALPMPGGQARTFLASLYMGTNTHTIAHTWREATPGNLIATAMKQAGAFQQKTFFYKITIPDNELTLQELNNQGALGTTFPVSQALTRRKYFLLYNNGNYQNADIIAFCHGFVDTKEATFLTTIPTRYIVGARSGQNTTKEAVPFAPFRRPFGPYIQ